jgi:hypothetical protein
MGTDVRRRGGLVSLEVAKRREKLNFVVQSSFLFDSNIHVSYWVVIQDLLI